VFRTRAAHTSEAKAVGELPAEFLAGVLDSLAFTENERFVPVDTTAGLVHVDPDQSEFLPDHVTEGVETPFFLGTDEDGSLWVDAVLPELLVDRLLVGWLDEVCLVDRDDRREVDAVVHHAVDQAVDVDLFTDRHVGVDVTVFAQHALDRLLVQVEVDARIDRQPVLGFPADADPWRFAIDPDLVPVQFLVEALVLVDLEHGEHEDDQVCRPDDREDGLSVTLARRGTFDQPRHVEHLDVRTPVLEHAGIDVQRRELVGTGLALGVGKRVQQRRLADARETHECDGGVAVFLDGVATAPAGGVLLFEFLLFLREFRLEPTDMGLCRLVVGRGGDFVFDLADLLFEPHQY
jgi:hypothetical protein